MTINFMVMLYDIIQFTYMYILNQDGPPRPLTKMQSGPSLIAPSLAHYGAEVFNGKIS